MFKTDFKAIFNESNIISLPKTKYDLYHIKVLKRHLNLHLIIKYIKIWQL